MVKIGRYEILVRRTRKHIPEKRYYPSKTALCKFIMKNIKLKNTESITINSNGIEIVEYII